ncbi:MAG: MFS transporter [Candidatus Thorarchaeota archaeon]|jgi:GPH family glycoside/pentoside/hexuronide:cation symporter
MLMLPLWKKIGYAMGRFGPSFLMTMITMTVFYVYGTRFELNWFLNGISLSASYIVIGLTHWLTGYYSDGLDTRWGRRRPFVVLGTPGIVVSGFLLFVPNWFLNTADPSLELQVFTYYLTMLCLFKFFYAFVMTAHQAWLPEVTSEDERPLVSGLLNTFNFTADSTGAILGFMTPLLFVGVAPQVLSDTGLTLLLVFCTITILFMLPSMTVIREKPDTVTVKRSLMEETRTAIANRTFVGWTLAVGFLSFTFIALTQQMVGFIQQVLLLDTIETLIPPALTMLGSTLVCFYLWLLGIRRPGKKKSLMMGLVVLAIITPLTPFLRGLGAIVGYTPVAIMFFAPVGAGMAIYYLMSYVVPADIAQVDEMLTGESRAGIYTGFIGVPLNMFQAASAVLLGAFMELSVILTGNELWGLMWWGPVFAPFLIVAAFILRYIDIDPDFEKIGATQMEDPNE